MTEVAPRPGPAIDDAVLVVPADLVLPAAARARLHRRFADRPAGVVGVVAPVVAIPPGSSVLAAADAATSAPADAGETEQAATVTGVALLEPGVGHRADDHTIAFTDPTPPVLLTDPGATAFDPAATDPDPAAPGAEPRGPFRWRPLVLLLASRPDPERTRVGARLAEALLGLDVEARLAVHDRPDGPLLTRPVPPDAASVAALRPDLVLALDPDAVAAAESWLAGIRTTVVALVDPALGDRTELVSWQIERAQGRLRARIGDGVDPAALAALVNRLCAGPVPEPPADPERTGALVTPVELDRRTGGDQTDSEPAAGDDAGASPDGPTTTIRATIPDRADAAPILAGLLDHLRAADVAVLTSPSAATTAGLLEIFLAPGPSPVPAGPTSATTSLLVRVVDREAERPGPIGTERTPLAITSSRSVAEQLRGDGVTTIVLPRLRTRAELDRATAAYERRVRPAVATIGILGDPASGPGADERATVVRAGLDRIRAGHPDLLVVVVAPEAATDAAGASKAAPIAFDVPWISTRRAAPDADELAGWSAALWLGAPGGPDAVGGEAPDELVRAALVGLPVIVAATDAPAIGALADRSIAVAEPADPSAWAERIDALLDDDRRQTASTRARDLAVAVHGRSGAALVVGRFLGWCREAAR